MLTRSRLGRLLSLAVLLLALLAAAPVDAERDFYKILGIPNDANEAQIKRAFRKLSLKYHPDKNKDNAEAQRMFMDVNEANEVLSDPDKRLIYDQEGEEGLKRQKEAAARGGGGGGLWDMFGGGGGGKRKGPDFRLDFHVTLEDLYNGASRTLNLKRRVICKSCKGTGAKGGETTTCKHCGGRGQVMSVQSLGPGFNIQVQQPCERCHGRGKMAKHVCPICQGARVAQEEKALELMIERGMRDGHEVVFERASEQHPDTLPGDVIVTLRTQRHARFTRKGNDLHMEHTISLREALLGHQSTFAHMDGHRVTIQTDGVTPPDHVKVLKGEGMPVHEASSDKGDLHVKFKINFPKQLTQQQQEALRAVFADSA